MRLEGDLMVDDSKADDTKPDETKVDDSKVDCSKGDDAKGHDPKRDDTKMGDSNHCLIDCFVYCFLGQYRYCHIISKHCSPSAMYNLKVSKHSTSAFQQRNGQVLWLSNLVKSW